MIGNLRSSLATLSAAAFAVSVMGGSALAQKKYDTGATDTEIKIGNIMPYSGPASAYGVIGKTIDAYFKKINSTSSDSTSLRACSTVFGGLKASS